WFCPRRELGGCFKLRVGGLRQLVIQIPQKQSQGDHARGVLVHECEPLCRRAYGFEERHSTLSLLLSIFPVGPLDEVLPVLGLFLDMDTYLIQERHEVLDWTREQPQAREGQSSVLHAVTCEKLRKRHQHEAFAYWKLHPGSDWLVVEYMPRSS